MIFFHRQLQGVDELGKTLYFAGIISVIVVLFIAPGTAVFYILIGIALVCLLIALFRTFLGNPASNTMQNNRFLSVIHKITGIFGCKPKTNGEIPDEGAKKPIDPVPEPSEVPAPESQESESEEETAKVPVPHGTTGTFSAMHPGNARISRPNPINMNNCKFFPCPKCENSLRVPVGKGKLLVTCAKCGNQFEIIS